MAGEFKGIQTASAKPEDARRLNSGLELLSLAGFELGEPEASRV